MIVVDASGLYEVITEGPQAEWVREQLTKADELFAPELIDVEIVGLLRSDVAGQMLDASRAEIALGELTDWPGERIPHRSLNRRVWDLRNNVRTSDAYYVALAEVLRCSLLTLDARLSRASGPQCQFLAPESR
jgi:predicted nucleic acid-binding protein